MSPADIDRLVREADLTDCIDECFIDRGDWRHPVTRFAALVEAAAMERAAKDSETQVAWVLEMLVAARLIAPETATTAAGIWRDASPAIRAAAKEPMP